MLRSSLNLLHHMRSGLVLLVVFLFYLVLPLGVHAHPLLAARVTQGTQTSLGGSTAKGILLQPQLDVQAMIDQVSSTTLHTYVGQLAGDQSMTVGGTSHTLTTRNSYNLSQVNLATQFAYEHLHNLGLATSYQNFTIEDEYAARNVIAEQPGAAHSKCVMLLVAHIDDTNDDSSNINARAPGADDNASGAAGVFMAADILHQYNFYCTLRYILFTGEEQDMLGSAAYADLIAQRGDDILGVLNMDMVAYNSAGDPSPKLGLHTRSKNAGDISLAKQFVWVVNTYNINLIPSIVQDADPDSDHSSFWDKGFPAIMAIEDYDDFNPEYHTANDKLTVLDMTYYTNFIKATVGTFAYLGGGASLGAPPSYLPLISH